MSKVQTKHNKKIKTQLGDWPEEFEWFGGLFGLCVSVFCAFSVRSIGLANHSEATPRLLSL